MRRKEPAPGFVTAKELVAEQLRYLKGTQMKILALDSSGMVASVAVFEDDTMIAEYTVNHKKTHSQTLLPMLDEVVRMTQTKLDQVDAIAIAAGPGSFTGLRIGASTAKGLGLALDIPLIPVPTVDALAWNLAGCAGVVCPIMDARRQQVYTGLYRTQNGQLEVLEPQMAIAVEELAVKCNAYDEQITFLGDGVPVYREMLDGLLRVPHVYAPGHLSRQRAGAVAALGMELYRKGCTKTAAEFAPDYLRVSQAERERKARESAE